MTVEWTFDEAKRLVEEVIAEVGEDYVYPAAGEDCAYFEEESGAPSCIVGHVLARAGIGLDDLDGRNYGHNVGELAARDFLHLDRRTETFLQDLQYRQDNGDPWGRAFELALGAVNDSGTDRR